MNSKHPEESELRILLLGRTGVGKSEAGNIILGKKSFEAKLSSASKTTKCQKETREFGGKTLAVVDTPGLFHTEKNPEEVVKEILECNMLISPGPHVLLLVLRADEFSQLDKNVLTAFQKIFENAKEHTIVLFTHGGQSDNEGFIKSHRALGEFLNSFEEYHVFNDKFDETDKDGPEVTDLLQKISNLVEKNESSPYTNEMFEVAAKVLAEAIKQASERSQVHLEDNPKEKALDLMYSWLSTKVDELGQIPVVGPFLEFLNDKAYELIMKQ